MEDPAPIGQRAVEVEEPVAFYRLVVNVVPVIAALLRAVHADREIAEAARAREAVVGREVEGERRSNPLSAPAR